MDILILHQGEQLGPFPDDAVHAMLKDGTVHIHDPAWRTGMKEWAPLVQVLYPAAAETPAPSPEPAASEPASERQKALLAYMGIAFSPAISRVDAAQLVNDAMENPRDPARAARWNEERLVLHPELFAEEIQARKEGRAQRFLEISQQAGAGLFEKVTKAHCQVLVGHLDVHSPNWDASEEDATRKHFFPALAEKFPQLVTDEGRRKFGSPGQAGAPARPGSASLAAGGAHPASSPAQRRLRAVFHGMILGLATLGALWLGQRFFPTPPTLAAAPQPIPAIAPGPETPAPPAPAPVADTPTPAAVPIPAIPPTTPIPAAASPAPAAMTAAASPAAPATEPSAPPTMPAPAPAGDLLAAPASTPPTRTTATLTKPIEVATTYGKVMVPAGKPVVIVQRNGPLLAVRYLDQVVEIPASSTDIDAEAPPPVPALPPAQ